MSKVDFRGKTVWITGASSGIGEELACQFAEIGAELILSARRKDKLVAVYNRCCKSPSVKIIPMDITSTESIHRAIGELQGTESLDLVIHNAGVAQKGIVEENHMDIEHRIMETNYFGTVELTKAILPVFKRQGHGWFAVVTSISGIIGVPGRSIYSASKHALHGFFESLRAEVFPLNIEVSIIMPGFINTEITLKELKGDGSQYGKLEKSHQMGMSAEICARKVIAGLSKRRKNIVVGGFEITGVYVKRYIPGLYDLLIRQHPMKKWRAFKRSLSLRKMFKTSDN